MTFGEAALRRRREVDRFAADKNVKLSDEQRHWLAAAVPLIGEPFEAEARKIPKWYLDALGVSLPKEAPAGGCVAM